MPGREGLMETKRLRGAKGGLVKSDRIYCLVWPNFGQNKCEGHDNFLSFLLICLVDLLMTEVCL